MSAGLSLVTLCILEVVLGLDNIFSFAILINQTPKSSRNFAKIVALAGAAALRMLLLVLFLAIQETQYPFSIGGLHWSVKEAFLFFGGLFLCIKALKELRHVAQPCKEHKAAQKPIALSWIIAEIIFIDAVFAIDSVLAALAVTHDGYIIATSIIASVIFMYFAADFVIKYMEQSWRFNVLGMILILIIGLFLVFKGLGIVLDHKILLSMILFGCAYELFISYIEHFRKKVESL